MRVSQDQWPQEWEAESLGTVCSIEIGKTPPRSQSQYWGGNNVWVKIGDMKKRELTDSEEHITDKALQDGQAKLVKAGTLLMSFKLTIGKLAFAGRDLYTNEAIAALSIKDKYRERLLPDFLYWTLQAVPLEEEADIAVKGRTLNKGKIARISIPLPEKRIQCRIVARIEALLAEVREAREIHRCIVENTERLMEAVLDETFSEEGMTSWDEDLLDNLIEITAGQIDPTLPEYRNLPHINGEVMTEKTCQLLPYHTAAEDGITSNKYLFSPRAVLYSKIRPYLRKAVLVGFTGVCSADVYPIRVKDERLVPDFLQWALVARPFTEYANSVSGRARIPKINRTQLFAYSMRFPTPGQQHRIAHYLRSVQREIAEMQTIHTTDHESLDRLEQAILAQAFRGEL